MSYGWFQLRKSNHNSIFFLVMVTFIKEYLSISRIISPLSFLTGQQIDHHRGGIVGGYEMAEGLAHLGVALEHGVAVGLAREDALQFTTYVVDLERVSH